VARTKILILLTSSPKIRQLLNFYHHQEQVRSQFDVVGET